MTTQPMLKLSTFAPERQFLEVETVEGTRRFEIKNWEDLTLSQQAIWTRMWPRIQALEDKATAMSGDENAEAVTEEDDAEYARLVEQAARLAVFMDDETFTIIKARQRPLKHIIAAFLGLLVLDKATTPNEMKAWAESWAKSLLPKETLSGSSRASNTTGRSRPRKRG